MKLIPENLVGRRVILASKSPRRKELLSLICKDFEIMPADIDESVPCEIDRKDAAEYTAKRKCLAISEKKEYSDTVVIACDTIVLVDDEILGKPKDYEDGFSMLRKLSGKEHSVISGVAISFKGEMMYFSQTSRVRFFDLTDEEIGDYLDSGEPFDKAGGYGIQGIGSLLVEGFEGDFFNIVGLPIARLRKELARLLEEE